MSSEVFESAEFIFSHQQCVVINEDALTSLAGRVESPVKWQDCPSHLIESNPSEVTALFVLIVYSLNFCFWSSGLEYDDLASGVRDNAFEQVGETWKVLWDPSRLSTSVGSPLDFSRIVPFQTCIR